MYLETVRLLALSAVAVALALGGVAVAQPAGIIDPWSDGGAEQDSWFAPSKSQAAPSPTPQHLDPWVKPPDASQTPSIAPTRAEPARAGVPTVVALGSPADVSVVNPWAPPVLASETPSLRPSTLAVNRTPNTPWAPGFVEIVDPWKRMPEWAPSERVRLVLDPWSR